MSRTISFAVAFALGALCLATLLLAQRVTATWQGQQLGTALERLASTRQAPLWLDRRVDPRQTVDVQFTDVPFAQALAKLTEQHSLGVTQLDSVIYVGPRKTARGLATLARRARAALAQAPAAQRQQWLRAAPSSWPRLTQPRALLKELLAQAGIELVDDKLVAHDLWQARELPPMALVDRAVLILAGFDLTCEISPDGKTCRVVPIEYPLPAAGDALLAEASSPFLLLGLQRGSNSACG
ncbi:MAG: STN domain-containing protein [Planctomycetes bacterium]|nr:STN domain-containing protein [Planctomycetota bacterium]